MHLLATIFALLFVSIEFYKAPRVEAGSIPNARDMVALASAANAKVLSGLGDMQFRERMWWINIGRQVRNSDEFGFMPSQGELFEFYTYLKPSNDAGTWPVAPAGEPEGANVASPIPAFIFGAEDVNFNNEEGRLGTLPLWSGAGFPATPEGQWELAKNQRGLIDPLTLAQVVPAIEAARAAQFMSWAERIPHAKEYGAFYPVPVEVLPFCGDTETEGVLYESHAIKMTALSSDVPVPSHHGTLSTDAEGRPVVTYAGSCPYWSLYTDDGHVQSVYYAGAFFIVFVMDGGQVTFDLFPSHEWREGPYTGDGELRRQDGGHYSRMIWAFIKDFRGTLAQRTPDTFNIEETAFDFDAFFTRQYHLAPNIGMQVGEEIVSAYPRARLAADQTIPSGTFLNFSGQDSHHYTDGFVLSGVFAKATNLFAPTSLEVLSGDEVIATITLTPGEPAVAKYLKDAIKPEPLKVRLSEIARFTEPGEIIFEANELLEYTPDHWDAGMLLRLAATAGGPEGSGEFLDGSGINQGAALQIFKDYEKHGCVVNTTAAGIRTQETSINTNPVYDSMRRVMNESFHMIQKREFLTYETDAQGRPVLRFKRYGLGNSNADMFVNIAPSNESVSEVIEGVEYIVRSHTGGKITYRDTVYSHEQRFTGAKESAFVADGDAKLLEYEGIRAAAPKNGWSNQWVMSEEFHFYHSSDSSLWKEDSFANWYIVGNRCQAYASNSTPGYPVELARVSDIPVHHTFDANFRNLHLSPEVPSGYNYALGANSTATDDFCKSCQVYQKPYEVISATVEFDVNGNDAVRLVFKEPFHRDASAPSVITRDAGAWDAGEVAALRAEPYRTTDNGLREYMLYVATNTHGSWKVGDSAAFSQIQTLPDNPFGSILPRFFFTSLVRKPYLDVNSSVDLHDTRITIDEFFKLEIKLNAWCRGAINGLSTQEHLCSVGDRPFDYTFQDLCFNAFGGLHLGRGHGPMVNTELDAETFNQYAACLDELYMFRLEGFMEFQTRLVEYSATIDKTPDWGDGGCPEEGEGMPTLGQRDWYFNDCPPEVSLDTEGAWSGGALGFTAQSSAIAGLCGPGGGELFFRHAKADAEFRYVPATGFENAISEDIQDLISNGAIGVYGTLEKYTEWARKEDTPGVLSACITCGGTGSAPFHEWTYVAQSSTEDLGCVLLTGGRSTAGNAPCGLFAGCAGPDPCAGAGWSEISGASTFAQLTFARFGSDDSAIIIVPLVEQEDVPT